MTNKIYGIFRNSHEEAEDQFPIFNLSSVTMRSEKITAHDLRRVAILGPLVTIRASEDGKLIFRFHIMQSLNLTIDTIFKLGDIEWLAAGQALQSIGDQSFSISKYPAGSHAIFSFAVLDQQMSITVHFADFLAACQDIIL